VAARERRVELLEMGVPLLVLDVDLHARMLRLERLVRGGHDLRPAGLCVDLQPDGDAVGSRLLRGAQRRGGDRGGRYGSDTEGHGDASLHLEASRVTRSCCSPCASFWPHESPAPLSWLIPNAIARRILAHAERRCQYQKCAQLRKWSISVDEPRLR